MTRNQRVRNLTIAAALLTISFFLDGCCIFHGAGSQRVSPGDTLSLNELIAVIQQQVMAAQDTLANLKDPISICEAAISLQVTSTTTVSGDFQVLIFKPSGKRIAQKVTTLTFDLKRPAHAEHPRIEALRKKASKDNLRDLVISAGRQYLAIKDNAIAGIVKNSLTVDVAFSVEYDGASDLSFNLFGNGGDAGLELDNRVQHELVLTFSVPGKCP